jgi:cell division protein FtsQ
MKVSHAPRLGSRIVASTLVALVVAAVGSVIAGLNSDVTVVRIRGDLSEGERAAVRSAISEAVATGYLTVSLSRVARAVLDLSWPRDVAVRRVWPSSLEVDVSKEAVAARWGAHGALSSSGEVIAVPQALSEELPLLDCARAQGAEAMQTYLLLKDGLRDTDLEIVKLVQDDFGEWRVTFGNGVELALGAEDLAERLGRFTSVYRGALAPRISEVARVDARYRNGVAVDWRHDAQRDPVPDGSSRPSDEAPRANLLMRGLAVTD